MDIDQCRLTPEEIWTALTTRAYTDEHQLIADAATEKTLRTVALWLRGFEREYPDRPEHMVACWRGHGLEMAADVLEAILAAAGGS